MATKTLFTTKDIMGQIGYYVRGTKVRFLHNEVERNGSIVQYLDKSQTYQILGTDDVSYFVKPHYIELCPIEPANQDTSPTMSNHQPQTINAGKTTIELSTNNGDKLALLELALNGSRGKQQRIIAEEGLAILELLLRKNHDYGSSVFKPPVLAPELSELSAIDVRMSDKIARINNLKTCASEVKSESIDETYKDLAGYVILRRSVQRYLLETDPSRSST